MTAPADGTARSIRVLVADYSALFRSGMRRAIEAEPGIEVMGEAGDADQINSLVACENPDVIVVGTVSPKPAVWKAISAETTARDSEHSSRKVGEKCAGRGGTGPGAASGGRPCALIAVVDLAGGSRQAFDAVFDAFRAGALGCVDRSIGAEELVNAIRVVSSGRHFASPQVVRILVDELARLKEVASGFEEAVAHAVTGPAGSVASAAETPSHVLTPRESEVLSLVACGKSNREIARTLSISEKTVKNHVSHILHKLGTDRRTQAAVWAISRGFSGSLGQRAHD
ncbi:MAG: response regulator transcription factor [Bacillota bacterium]